jgi:hypothetical protein
LSTTVHRFPDVNDLEVENVSAVGADTGLKLIR